MSNRERAVEVLRACREQDRPTARAAERLESAGLITPDMDEVVPYWNRNAQKAQAILHDSYWKLHKPERMVERLEAAGLIAPDTTPTKEEGNSNESNA